MEEFERYKKDVKRDRKYYFILNRAIEYKYSKDTYKSKHAYDLARIDYWILDLARSLYRVTYQAERLRCDNSNGIHTLYAMLYPELLAEMNLIFQKEPEKYQTIMMVIRDVVYKGECSLYMKITDYPLLKDMSREYDYYKSSPEYQKRIKDEVKLFKDLKIKLEM